MPAPVVTGDLISAAQWNAIATVSAVQFTKNAAQSISDTTTTGVSWLTEVQRNDPLTDYTYQDSGGSETRIIRINREGWYHVTAYVLWASNNTGRRALEITDSGTRIAEVDVVPGASVSFGQIASATRYFHVNDYIRVQVFHTAGTSLNVSSASYLSIFRVMA